MVGTASSPKWASRVVFLEGEIEASDEIENGMKCKGMRFTWKSQLCSLINILVPQHTRNSIWWSLLLLPSYHLRGRKNLGPHLHLLSSTSAIIQAFLLHSLVLWFWWWQFSHGDWCQIYWGCCCDGSPPAISWFSWMIFPCWETWSRYCISLWSHWRCP